MDMVDYCMENDFIHLLWWITLQESYLYYENKFIKISFGYTLFHNLCYGSERFHKCEKTDSLQEFYQVMMRYWKTNTIYKELEWKMKRGILWNE